MNWRYAIPLLSLLLFGSAAHGEKVGVSVAVEPAVGNANVIPLYWAFGGIGGQAIPPPPGFEAEFAVAVVEINSPSKTANVAVTDFVLFDQAGKATKLKRVVQVEEFDRSRIATEVISAYYENPGGTRP